MAVSAARDDRAALLHQRLRQDAGVVDHGALVQAEFRPQRLAKRHSLGGYDVHQRPALQPWENGRVEFLGQRLVICQNHATTGATQRLVRCGGADVGVRHRRRVHARGDQTGVVRHVHQEVGSNLIGHGANTSEVDRARIGAAAGDDHLRALGPGELLQLLVIKQAIILAHAVLHGAEPLTRQVGRCPVRQMAAGGQRHAEDAVARLQQGQEHSLVRLRARMRLHVGEPGTE